ncbi:SMP-30/gluconolactonase/LRE family protein [Cyclobacterium sp.]|uniref:SMP-30/gluconolactonase/LRE family protein n=1 Tax=Cyclobacterium sp. TaxID=1966343 RepID=UPI0019C254D0|nr:SMP-30/gluconolactonase/LRE family protein [Cyclobacterium sp.]MBD3627437.1 SMP-30/gluconolactonase/LRE family protein [Cyclobacterium sp.]
MKKLILPILCLLTTLSMSQTITQNDARLGRLVDQDAEVRQLAEGLKFTEGPVWDKNENVLLFSDIPANIIYKLDTNGELVIYRKPSNNANGLTFDAEGNLLIAEHSGRKIGQLSPDGDYRAVVESYKGIRFNSPNDVIIDSKGIIYFTDPPYGLPNDATDTLGFNGVYQYRNGKVTLISRELDRPNGLALSPDERTLYVANSGSPKKYIKFPVSKNGKVGKSELFYDVSGIDKPGNPDGIKVDTEGHLYATGPGGVWVFSADGKHLGTIAFPETPANIAFGGPDMKTLFVTARTGLYAVELKVPGK